MRNMKGFTALLIFGLVFCRPVFAQSGSGQIANSGAIKAGVVLVIVGVGAGITYLVLHDRSTMVGCVQADSHGSRIVDEENKKSYALVSGASVVVPPGDRVKLKGRIRNNSSGETAFHVQKLVKDYGHCQH
jgi:hypothetical protein